MGEVAAASGLLERESEIEELRALIDRAIAGLGGVALVEGPPGIGKTELLRVVRELSLEAGAMPLQARGSELERDFGFGVARQLFQAPVAALPEDERGKTLSGAAALAGSVLGVGDVAPSPAGEIFPTLHGLHWLCANLALSQPLTLIVDDAQWADEPSLRFLHYLAGRIEELPVLAVIASRSAAPEASVPLLAAARAENATRAIALEPLSEAATGEVLSATFHSKPDPEFARASWEASGGNPFLVTELARSLAVDGIDPTAESAGRIAEISSEPIARTIFTRLTRMGDAAQEIARWTAVLGAGAELRDAAALAELDQDTALAALDALAAEHILAAGMPLDFTHPLIRSAIYADLAPGERARRHARAARLLRERGARPEQIASHLLASEPGADPNAIATLRDAADDAIERGAPQAAVRLLERALDEPSSAELRHDVLVALTEAAVLAGDPRAPEWGDTAIATAPNARARAETLIRVVWVGSTFRAQPDSGARMLEIADALPSEDADLASQLEAVAALIATAAMRFDEHVRARVDSWNLTTGDPTFGQRMRLAASAALGLVRNQPASFVLDCASRAIPQHDLWGHAVKSEWGLWHAIAAQAHAGDAASALAWITPNVESLRKHGSAGWLEAGLGNRCYVHFLLGNLEAAEADAYAAIELEPESLFTARGLFYGYAIRVLIERGRLSEGHALVEKFSKQSLSIAPPLFRTVFAEARGELALASGDPGSALREYEGIREATLPGWVGSAFLQWRPGLVRALFAAGQHEEAQALADHELELAHRFGAPRVLGRARRIRGTLTGGPEGIEDLRQAVSILEGNEARLEHAHALVELGAALRRANQRKDAREPLREGLDLARRCGATVLADRAREELKATGARPRKEVLSGVESLTPSERRVARLAAEGLTNREIAQQLFVTQKTVETHLGHCFQKLDITGRKELAESLAPSR